MAKNNDKKVLIHIEDLKQYFPIKKTKMFQKEQLYVKANDGISLDIYEGETVGLVGESGCGKSTFGRVLLQLYHQTDGRTMYHGRTIDELAPKYVEDILKNLVSKREHLDKLYEKETKVQEEYNNISDPEQKRLFEPKLDKAKKEAHDLFLDIVQLIGGLYVADNLQEVSSELLKKYNVSVRLFKLNQELNDVKISTGGKGSNSSKVADLEAKIKTEQKELDAIKSNIDNLKKKYASNKDFAKYEEYLDNGINLTRLKYEEMRYLRKDLQIIFQDPYSSLDPRMSVGQIIGEGLLTHKYFDKNGQEMQEYIMKVMEDCGLAPYFIHRYPHQFSGGQRQRIGIARSLALKPKFVVCDEAVSALDVSIQSQVVNLLLDLKEKENLTYLFISHDLSVIKYISDRIGVMYLGNLVELATTEELFANTKHPYTEALLSVIPTTDIDVKKEVVLLEGDIPSPIKPPSGCKFHTRCRYCTDICKQKTPAFEEVAPGHFVACHHKLGENK
ncbi:oligopeptide/dipeptide ABC transporter ATP-binding protein [Anaeromicropila herbilytica]|uniref:ABC transporter domain-containing protein n=1 Tax=Anaeromicropila herbilytica TaxID=2785025 RepID=A0A7R7EJU9_9FIRM|nr:hypothetical protein bsdtb5_14710 [Anaeromicropila herbilytica]